MQPVNGRNLGKTYYQILNQKKILSGDSILLGEKSIEMIEMFRFISDILNEKITFIRVPLSVGLLIVDVLKSLFLERLII